MWRSSVHPAIEWGILQPNSESGPSFLNISISRVYCRPKTAAYNSFWNGTGNKKLNRTVVGEDKVSLMWCDQEIHEWIEWNIDESHASANDVDSLGLGAKLKIICIKLKKRNYLVDNSAI